MNVFSDAAIAELVVFSEWLRGSDVKVSSSARESHRHSAPVPTSQSWD